MRTSDRRPAPGRRFAGLGFLARLAWAACLAGTLAGCDFVAQNELVVGRHTEQDVRALMGTPAVVWEEESGQKRMEYPRGPMGTQTWFVHIAPDGRYLGMAQALVAANFDRIKVGMSTDDARWLLGRQTEITPYALAQEVVWSWRYEGDAQKTMFFNAHFDRQSGRIVRISRNEDWKTQG